MATAQLSKRPRADDLSQDHRPKKKIKSAGELHHRNFSPEFYDNLSKRSELWFTTRALRELDRRNEKLSKPKPIPAQEAIRESVEYLRGDPKIARFARTGGPDLCDLRGCPGPTSIPRAMPSSPTASSKPSHQSTKATTVTSKTKRSSAYDANLEQHLINHHVYPPFHDFPDDRTPPEPTNWEEIRQVLKVRRGSLSPSVVPSSAFADFRRKNNTKSEGTIMRTVVPLIAGNINIPNEGQLPFVNLDSITDNTTVNPVPDFFDGARPAAVDRQVREDLDKIIVPTKHASVPIAPNLFMEAKAPTGSLDVAERQAVLDGAHGALMMHALQNYLQEQPVYDGKAYAFTATLLGGYLALYAHHLTAPAEPEERPNYHMTQLKAYALRDDEMWLEGLAAFRNLRNLAKDYRDRLIDIANARARDRRAEPSMVQGDDTVSTTEEQVGGRAPLDDCQLFDECLTGR